ncbi:uncharacterized protein LOC124920028 [Impatiens glandulifera]|uniref:uncharacterized protein LOC124920028 n=1 Tax=Impatiens glandulifera TaxID=253017 RepID=UPI001FB0DD22|nr:uncharacterized protein LOC124920028 [Impatiens glandulifera]
MLRLCHGARRCIRAYSSRIPRNSSQFTAELNNPQKIPPPVVRRHDASLSHSFVSSRTSIAALSFTVVSAVVASYLLLDIDSDVKSSQRTNRIYAEVEEAVERSNESIKRILYRMKQTGVAASVLWKSLQSVLSSANNEVRSGFEFRVAAFLADIAAANAARREALVGAGGGAVVDWLLETVSVAGDHHCAAQAEAARALAYLIADQNVQEIVFGRPHAVPYLLRFIFSSQPQRSKKQSRRTSSFDVSDSLKGRSMLVAALMDVITANCDGIEKAPFKSLLPKDAEMRDIASAIEVIEEGGMHLNDPPESEEDDDDGGEGIKGIGIKVLGGTTVLGFSRNSAIMEAEANTDSKSLLLNKANGGSLKHRNKNATSNVVPGLWDDLLCQHVAVPFAAWALANWAMASDLNRSHIQELDGDGLAVMSALTTAERSVKWHGSLVARSLLEDYNLPLNDSVDDWTYSLLSTVSQATKSEDIPLAQVALSAFLVSIERSPKAQAMVLEKGLHLMRETAKRTKKDKPIQEAIARGLELLCSNRRHLSIEESQKWSGILLPWIFEHSSSDAIRISATKILSSILEDYGPSSVPISQAWLALLLADVLDTCKKSIKEKTKSNDKVKTQVDQANILYAQQVSKELANAVVNLAVHQLGTETENEDTFPLLNLLALEPFLGTFKNLKKESLPKIDAADSASAAFKGIKALTELCADDPLCQNKIFDNGVLCLLRHFLLQDDYEQLAAAEAYDASRAREMSEKVSTAPGGNTSLDSNDTSSVRIPSAAHIRRHAARLLSVLSFLPKVHKAILADEDWQKWLEECACGRIPGCHDVKIQSYARSTLLNTLCADQTMSSAISNENRNCPRYSDMIFLINPELPHWKCTERDNDDNSVKNNDISSKGADENGVSSTSEDVHQNCSNRDVPALDVVFVHGLRGGPFKTWRLSEDKTSTKSGLVEKIDEEAGKQGTFWPGEWISADIPHARIFSLKYKTNLTQWSGATLPMQEVSSMLLEKLVDAGIGDRPVVFVTHSMGGLVVKQILYQAKVENKENIVNNTVGVIFYSCPHFGSRLADMPWKMGLVLRPAPTIGELRSGSPRLIELNDFIRRLHKRGLEVLSFCETKVTPIVEGYGGWAFRMEIVAIESAYPGFGQLVVLDSTDHVNSCKPLSRSDPSYAETLDFLRNLKAQYRSYSKEANR